ncbi:MAG: hypothetical protein J7M34_14585 [Anaerolineae bacterium]|nr:hypothetical protein [Anaerolineae bacterium]
MGRFSRLEKAIAVSLLILMLLPLGGVGAEGNASSAFPRTPQAGRGALRRFMLRRPHGVPGRAGASSSVTVVDVDLPSASTGSAAGTLALRIYAPAAPSDARYADGAPVVVYVPGGDSLGQLRPFLFQATDMIRIVFLFPGGVDATTGRRSGGTYDHRGNSSIAALRDVVLFAAGKKTDASGQTIDDLLSVPVLHDNIGLIGSSNGGNIVTAVAALYGTSLAGYLRYIVQWESPVSSQIATTDLGGVILDCPPGLDVRLAVTNPRYYAYGPLVLGVDYSQIAYDPASTHPVFLDGNGDGTYTTVDDPSTGCRTPDLNGNRLLDVDEDFPLRAYTDGTHDVYSRPATQALVDHHVFSGTWPSRIATVPQANAFWDLREAVRLYPDAVTNIPGLEGMVLATVVDHVQTASDKPHIRQAFEGWDNAGAWVQINPSPSYMVEADPTLAGRTDLPNNAPNTPPADWSDAASYAVPEDVSNSVLQSAAVRQMADRTHATSGGTPTPTPTVTPTLAVSPTPTATVSPTATSTPTSTPTGTPPVSAGIYMPLMLKGISATPGPAVTTTPTSGEIPPLYVFYVIHTQIGEDYYPYTDPSLTTVDPVRLQNMMALVKGIRQVADGHGFEITWEFTQALAKGVCSSSSEDDLLSEMQGQGHEIAAYAHTLGITETFRVLSDVCGVSPEVLGGYMIDVVRSGEGKAQETLSHAITIAVSNGYDTGTINISPAVDPSCNPFADICHNQIGDGNDMWNETGNLLFP